MHVRWVSEGPETEVRPPERHETFIADVNKAFPNRNLNPPQGPDTDTHARASQLE